MKITCRFLMLLFQCTAVCAQKQTDLPKRHIITFNKVEREYYIQHPSVINTKKTYWLLVVVHGGGGNGRTYWLADGIAESIADHPLPAIIVTPSFSNTDVQASRFPQLGEGEFLIKVIEDMKRKYQLHDKILLTGYSRGGQFTHRFALQHSEMVKACAAYSAGTWTTPDGKLLLQNLDVINDPESFLNDKSCALLVPERLRGMFDPRVAKVAGMLSKQSTTKIPFLVMCGTLDPRIDISKQFASSLKAHGYEVKFQWPQTPHGGRKEYPEEFSKFATGAVSFFLEVITK